MARRLLRVSVLGMLTFSLLLGGGSAGADGVHSDPNASIAALPECNRSQSQQFELRSTIAFASSRDHVATLDTEIYLGVPMEKDDGSWVLTQQQTLTNTPGNAFAALSPDGKRIVFDSNRDVQGPLHNISDLFVMNADGTDQTVLTRHSSSATWSPDCKYVAFHASASGNGKPINRLPGAGTADSDIFVLNVDDCLKVIEQAPPRADGSKVDDCREIPGEHLKNITNSPHTMNADGTPACSNTSPGYINEDADWSPDGTMIAFIRHLDSDCGLVSPPPNYRSAELYVMSVSPNGTPVQVPQCLTCQGSDAIVNHEERAPAWAPNGERIVFMCRRGAVLAFQLCVRDKPNVNGTWPETQLTNTGGHSTPTWSPDGKKIVFHTTIGTNPDSCPVTCYQLFLIRLKDDGTCDVDLGQMCAVQQLTDPPGLNFTAKWGVARVHVKDPKETQPSTSVPAGSPVPKR